jgi:hypothetical protein
MLHNFLSLNRQVRPCQYGQCRMCTLPLRAPRIRARQIGDNDLNKVLDLLVQGFGARRTRQFWKGTLEGLKSRVPPEGLPKYGYVLEADGTLVGVVLLVFSMPDARAEAKRCNVSSWYVDPAYRSYAPWLVAQALKHKGVTFTNISSMPHTRPIIEAQGFLRYSNGLFIALPLFQLFADETARVVPADSDLDRNSEWPEHDLLKDHARYGCVSLWCRTAGHSHPFVFRPRLVRGIIPCTQLIYCRAIEDFVRFARPIGAFLASRGRVPVIIDANGPIPRLCGIYLDGKMPKYFRGPDRPRLGDLAYTEAALFGI